MTPDRFRQVEALYHAAREATADGRAALLLETDPELRRKVESLLSQQTGGEFLDRAALENAPELFDDQQRITSKLLLNTHRSPVTAMCLVIRLPPKLIILATLRPQAFSLGDLSLRAMYSWRNWDLSRDGLPGFGGSGWSH